MRFNLPLVTALLVASCGTGSSMAAINDAYVWQPDGRVVLPPAPEYGPNGTTSWPGWTPFEPGDDMPPITLPFGSSIFFGLGNQENTGTSKDILMTFHWTSASPFNARSPVLGISQQLPSPSADPAPWTSIRLDIFNSSGEVSGTITPCPAWEYFELKNNQENGAELMIIVTSFFSEGPCVPAPGVIAVFALTGTAGFRSRRRR
jgi:hypothetical protein